MCTHVACASIRDAAQQQRQAGCTATATAELPNTSNQHTLQRASSCQSQNHAHALKRTRLVGVDLDSAPLGPRRRLLLLCRLVALLLICLRLGWLLALAARSRLLAAACCRILAALWEVAGVV